MKVIRNASTCELHGECELAAPGVFEIRDDDDDAVTVLNPEPGEELREQVERAALNCPTSSIRIEG
jgi:ferredoxin